MKTKQKTIGARIRQVRSDLGLTQEELGHRTDLHYTYVGAVERGEVNVSIANMEKLAQGLGVELYKLFIPEHLSPGPAYLPPRHSTQTTDVAENPIRQLSEISKYTVKIFKNLDKLNGVMIHSKSNAIEMLLDVVKSIVCALECKAQWTREHAMNVERYTKQLGEALGLNTAENNELRLAALLHDIGIMVSNDSVWGKTGDLSERDYKRIKEHPVKGEEIFGSVAGFKTVCLAIRHHHERWDGGGYPDGLQGDQIPLYARIIAVSEMCETMTANNRPNAKSLSKKRAIKILKEESGKQLDPEIVKVFIDKVNL